MAELDESTWSWSESPTSDRPSSHGLRPILGLATVALFSAAVGVGGTLFATGLLFRADPGDAYVKLMTYAVPNGMPPASRSARVADCKWKRDSSGQWYDETPTPLVTMLDSLGSSSPDISRLLAETGISEGLDRMGPSWRGWVPVDPADLAAVDAYMKGK